ncbi:MAG: hypothetical protein ACYDAG_16240, partial [Chloroflexota bacterium]
MILVLLLVGVQKLRGALQVRSYNAGVKAADAREWHTAVDSLRGAGDYADAKVRLQSAEVQLHQQDTFYRRADAATKAGGNWAAAFDLRLVEDVGPKYRDTEKRLADLRAKNGKLLFIRGQGPDQTVVIADADGGNQKDIMSGTGLSVSFLGDDGRVAYVRESG